jgi:hypothetical protein
VVESHKTLNQHDGQSPKCGKCNRRSSDNAGTSGLDLESITKTSARRILTKGLEKGAITEKPAPSSPDFTSSEAVLSESVRDSEMGNIWSDAGQLRPDPFGTNQVDGMPLLDSPMRGKFWYSFLDPLPIDVDFSSTQPLY